MFASGKTAAVASAANYIEDVFSTYLYTGNSSTQTITNGIDLSTKGGMIWLKSRSNVYDNFIVDTVRGFSGSATRYLVTNSTAAQNTDSILVSPASTGFLTNGFTLANNTPTNFSGYTYASWTFRKQPKFFDVVTYTGTGSNTTISHSLGSVPACIMVKRTDTTGAWQVYHRSLANTEYLVLNTTAAKATGATRWNSTTPTSTVFSIGTDATVNASGGTYVAYLFAHDAGGFGLTGTDNVISCGSYTESVGSTITLGYEPQYLLLKRTDAVSGWFVFDTMRGLSDSNGNYVYANTSGAEVDAGQIFLPQATGFKQQQSLFGAGVNVIYIAIRRGPMKVPTSGTSVFVPTKVTGSAIGQTYSIGFPSDLFIGKDTSGASYVDWVWQSRLTGDAAMSSDSTSKESITAWGDDGVKWTYQNSIYIQSTGYLDTSPILYTLRRAPSFFDEVCYTGTGSATTFSHNLGVAPELMIVKDRSSIGTLWITYAASQGNTKYADLSDPSGFATGTYWNNTSPTSSVFSVSALTDVNSSGDTYVAYLFATCAGVSKVGSYTGTGTTLQVDCGFTGGARFVLIKRTDSTGDWYVWDTARGIVSGNDPYLLLNSTAAEVTNTDYIDTYSAGFEISSTAPAAINASGGTFIFLAIA